ncbi:MAG: hypothetical protein QNJ58_18440 [Desulfobacterales bacterium]|nr:hypothetical protein [Desulfobacterales bacterium]
MPRTSCIVNRKEVVAIMQVASEGGDINRCFQNISHVFWFPVYHRGGRWPPEADSLIAEETLILTKKEEWILILKKKIGQDQQDN